MIQLIFRKTNQSSFSIEKVFAAILPGIVAELAVETQFACTRSARLTAVLRNLYHLRKIKGALFHITGDIHYAVFAFRRSRTILTIHDCVFLNYSSGIKRWLFRKVWLQWPVRYAQVITTISEKSKQEIIDHTGCNPDKIVVIPDPVPSHIYHAEKPFDSTCPIILFIGTKPNKNLFRAIESLQGITCELQIVGKLSPEQLTRLVDSGIRYKNYINLNDEELAQKYASCDIVLYPSTYEGFGLPMLEAQQARKPIVAGNISPMKDVAGGGACLVDPYNGSSIREGVLRIINDREYREKIVKAGIANTEQYRAEKIAGQYCRLYKALLADGSWNTFVN